MRRRSFLQATGSATFLAQAATSPVNTPAPGVWSFRIGSPESITPVRIRQSPPAAFADAGLPPVSTCPVTVQGSVTRRGCLVRIPLGPNELVYGLGLMLQSFLQRGQKRLLRVNADPLMDSGDSHAPVPFYVTTRGYGILIDTARNVTVYAGNQARRDQLRGDDAAPAANGLPAAYSRYHINESSEVLIEVPRCAGVDVYVFGGPSLREAVQRYNLFSGGGALPPRWGLGVCYRVKGDFTQEDVERMAADFRRENMPCDVLGLEPGWQTHAYSCSYAWDRKFPDPAGMTSRLRNDHYRLNLWEHAFVHSSSPIRQPLTNHSGDYQVWDGLVPDFLAPDARRIFANYHRDLLVSRGIAAFKLDECDNSDFTGAWSFPDHAAFPSGADGEQMHNLFGLGYQGTILKAFDQSDERTYGLCRSSGALAAPMPFVLYSDLYDHTQFIRGLATMGFSGLLWTPEVRHAASPEDLVRRLQSVVLSPLALINAWYIKMPPWKQVSRDLNNQGKVAHDADRIQAACREVLELRMRLIPYLHAAFVRYQREGLPPFRALVMDYPSDPGTFTVDDQYMMGDSLMVAPVVAGSTSRSLYLPPGSWFDFWTGKSVAGGRRITVPVPLAQVPIYVKDGTLLPLARPTLHVEDPVSLQLTAQAYGPGPSRTVLYEDSGKKIPTLRKISISWDPAAAAGQVHRPAESPGPAYVVQQWIRFA